MNKKQFLQRLQLAGEKARQCAAKMVAEQLPEDLCFTISSFDNPQGRRGAPGTIKFLGGRFVKRSASEST